MIPERPPFMAPPNESGSLQEGDPAPAGPGTTRIGLLQSLGVAFCCCHAAFLCYSLVPASPTRVDKGHPVLDFYRVAISGRQRWNLLDTIPAHHSLNVRIEGHDQAGTKLTAGAVLPGLKPYPQPENIRSYGLFYQLIFASDKAAYRDAYFQKAAQVLGSETATQGGANWSLVVDAEYTRTLVHSRRDGRLWLSMPTSIPFGAAPGTPP